jgi:Protein of unknown function (DUF2997)
MNGEIEISIDAHGKVTIETKGIKGASCLEAVAALAEIIGRQDSTELTSEYYEQPLVEQSHISQHLRHS